jgi:hypothetical protein
MNMTFKFEKSLYSQPRMIAGISVTKTGLIGLPKFFLASHVVQRGVQAYLYWDARNKAIAIEFTDSGDPAAYPVHFTQQYGAFIQAIRFFRYQHLDPSDYKGRYRYARISGEEAGLRDARSNVFVMDLRKPYTQRNWAA